MPSHRLLFCLTSCNVASPRLRVRTVTHAIVLCFLQITVNEEAGFISGICPSISRRGPWAGLLNLQPTGIPYCSLCKAFQWSGCGLKSLYLNWSSIHQSILPSICPSWQRCSSSLRFRHPGSDSLAFRLLLLLLLQVTSFP